MSQRRISSVLLSDLDWRGLLGLLNFAIDFGKVPGSLFHCLHPMNLFLGLSTFNASPITSQGSLQINDRSFDRKYQLCFAIVSVEIP